MKYFSMFSGIGGFEHGIERAFMCIKNKRQEVPRIRNTEGQSEQLHEQCAERLSCIGFSEIDKYAISIYKKHFPNHKEYGDATRINTSELPDFDCLVGGFPCQDFSIAGKRRGFDEARGTLFFEIARILRDKRPRCFVLENVKGLLSHDSGKTFQTILKVLTDIGYRVEWQVLNSKDFGVPQNRERVFIIGHFGNRSGRKVFPLGESNGKFNDKPIQKPNGGCTRPIFRVSSPEESRREIQSRYSIRRLTPTECARLQGFPDDWCDGLSDTQQYKCYGNAVSTPVITAIFKEIIKWN